ncbi:DUF3742 family protein [Pseudomonas syringae]|uniref:DUF3742 family protein n=1 Tax=Pseudomonas syringae TaxID=317 RepID=UPI00200B77A6|nr:DUF3742 family protein [Pseudomonas syringae]MCK9744214.1 DUF3742 family protein [Pseudomonas syringae pv. syringae]MCK9769691.1 DUF3742 family protein [Pseudomonas syringae pv. syringae]
MSTNAKKDDGTAMRIGQSLGRGVAAFMRLEKAFWSSLSRVGMPALIATAVKWSARVAILGAGAFFAAWGLLYVLAVVCFLAIAIGFVTNPGIERALRGSQLVHFDDDRNPYRKELREDLDGFGTYIGGQRVD